MAMLLWLSLCVATVIQLTASQSTIDCQRFGEVLTLLSHMETAISTLKRDVADLKIDSKRTCVRGKTAP